MNPMKAIANSRCECSTGLNDFIPCFFIPQSLLNKNREKFPNEYQYSNHALPISFPQ